MTGSNQLKGVLLDIDGTLVDSNDAHASAWLDVLRDAGVDTDFHSVRALIGMGADHLLPKIAGIEKNSPRGQELEQRRSSRFHEKYLPTLQAFPKARELLEELKQHGLKLIVATSASQQDLKGLLERGGFSDLMDAASDSSQAEASKPDADIIDAALRAGRLEPEEALLLGDTPYDVTAARRAGVDVIGFTCGGWSRAHLSGTVAVYDGPADLLAKLKTSPILCRPAVDPKREGERQERDQEIEKKVQAGLRDSSYMSEQGKIIDQAPLNE